MTELLASIGLAWGVAGGKIVVYKGGIRKDLLPSILAPVTGLLKWLELDDGGVQFTALAQPMIEPGGQITINDVFGVPVGGGPLRVERVTFSGSTVGTSTMEGVARKLQLF